MNIKTDLDLKITKRLDYERVERVCGALFEAFHPNGLGENEELDERFHSHWILFLHTVGWTEDEYWEEKTEQEENNTCPDCGKIMDGCDEDDLESNPLNLPEIEKKNSDSGMN